jgi:hypothetical protein
MTEESKAKPRFVDRDAWQDFESAVDICAYQLQRGRLALVLGAGASIGFELPDWSEIVAALYARVNAEPRGGISLGQRGEELLRTHYMNDRVAFSQAIYDALYDGADSIDDRAIRENELVAAIGALAGSDRRGALRTIVNFNVDDFVERYFTIAGVLHTAIEILPAWRTHDRVRIVHPHGLLRYGEPVTRPAVFAQIQSDEQTADETSRWVPHLSEIFLSHTCVFVGLSGEDDALRLLLTKAKQEHIGSTLLHPYWGIRFAKDADPMREMWDERNVANMTVRDWPDIPAFLFSVCKRAMTASVA